MPTGAGHERPRRRRWRPATTAARGPRCVCRRSCASPPCAVRSRPWLRSKAPRDVGQRHDLADQVVQRQAPRAGTGRSTPGCPRAVGPRRRDRPSRRTMSSRRRPSASMLSRAPRGAAPISVIVPASPGDVDRRLHRGGLPGRLEGVVDHPPSREVTQRSPASKSTHSVAPKPPGSIAPQRVRLDDDDAVGPGQPTRPAPRRRRPARLRRRRRWTRARTCATFHTAPMPQATAHPTIAAVSIGTPGGTGDQAGGPDDGHLGEAADAVGLPDGLAASVGTSGARCRRGGRTARAGPARSIGRRRSGGSARRPPGRRR